MPNPGAIIAKLRVAERLVRPEDHPDAHVLIADCVSDLGRLPPDERTVPGNLSAARGRAARRGVRHGLGADPAGQP
jgi:hypothetical protein